ncbi:4-(cytidine 5'-diphospho)-2-C-methyl-D-erythritol kinase [Caulobacter sp. KR2-114]|uniref:4-(cytidine 5'-diphospho)-2-C-methyl-D-erythritol kinase n=1 Tax=Caulobacter sp. KR2-114 TaxID=3400912 RepID=UPI003BFDF58F
MSAVLERLAPAKVNLFLHVGALAADGYHPLSSLMAFADVGDVVRLEPAEAMSFAITGPFGAALSAEADNLVTRARDMALAAFPGEHRPFRLVLDKRLPIAAGIGGGSADAAAALRLLDDALGLDLGGGVGARFDAIARALGSDVPACLAGQPTFATGRGDDLGEPPRFVDLDIVLANPRVPSPTGAVYRAYDDLGAPGGAEPPTWAGDLTTPATVTAFLQTTRNDLEAPAIGLTPAIGDCLDILRAQPESLFVRMSGSGATCFAIVESAADAERMARGLTTTHPHWWVRAARLKGSLG